MHGNKQIYVKTWKGHRPAPFRVELGQYHDDGWVVVDADGLTICVQDEKHKADAYAGALNSQAGRVSQ